MGSVIDVLHAFKVVGFGFPHPSSLHRFLWRGNFTFATSRHISRDDVFEEADAVTADLKCNKAAVNAQMDAYRAAGMKPFSLQHKFPIVTGE